MLGLSVLVATVAASAVDAFPPLQAGIGYPRAVAMTSDGRVLIVSSKPSAVFELAADGLRVLRVDPVREDLMPGGPERTFAGIASCADGGLYLSAGREVLSYTAPDRWTSIPVALASPALTRPAGLACDTQGRLVIADPGAHRIWRFDPRCATLDSIAGSGLPGDSGDGGPAVSARLSSPESVAVAADGTVFIADRGNRRIRWVRPDQHMDGTAGPPAMIDPTGVALVSATTLAIADTGGQRIYRLAVETGRLTVVAGNGTEGFSGDGGPALTAQLRRPSMVTVTAEGALLVADAGNRRLRQITPSGIISTITGNGGFGSVGDGGPALAARLAPTGLAVDQAGNLYVAEGAHHRIRRIARQTGLITTLAGTGLEGSGGDGGPGTAAELSSPSSVAAAADGTLYIGDTGNKRVRRISPAGKIDTLTGGWNDGCCETRSLVLADGSLLIAESYSLHRVPLPGGERSLVWSRSAGEQPTRVNREDLERIDAMSVGAGGDVYVSRIRPGAVWRVDLATGKVQLAVAEAAGAAPTLGPTTLAMEARTKRLLFANLWGPCVFAMDVASKQVAMVADLKTLTETLAPVRLGVTAVAASAEAIYFADAWRVFRIGSSGRPEVVAGGGRGY